MNNDTKKMILRYASIVALGDEATQKEKQELVSIEDELHLTKGSILAKATEFALAQIK